MHIYASSPIEIAASMDAVEAQFMRNTLREAAANANAAAQKAKSFAQVQACKTAAIRAQQLADQLDRAITKQTALRRRA